MSGPKDDETTPDAGRMVPATSPPAGAAAATPDASDRRDIRCVDERDARSNGRRGIRCIHERHIHRIGKRDARGCSRVDIRTRPTDRVPRDIRARRAIARAAGLPQAPGIRPFPSAAVEPPSPDVAPVEAESALPGMHRGGFERWPTAPVGIIADPQRPGSGCRPCSGRPRSRQRRRAGWRHGRSDSRSSALVVSTVRGLGVPDRPRRDRHRDHRAAPPAREPRRRGVGARAGRVSPSSTARAGCCSRRAAPTCSAERAQPRYTRSARIASRFEPMRVRISVADPSPRSFSAVRSAAGSMSTPRFLISSRPMSAIAQGARQRPRLGGQHLAHAEARDERARQRRIRGQIGDLLGQHPRLQRAGDVADQPCADHRAVGLVHECPERTHRLVRGIRRRGELPRVVAAHHERRPPHAVARQRARPQHELDRRPVGAHPLRLDVVGDHRAVQARDRA